MNDVLDIKGSLRTRRGLRGCIAEHREGNNISNAGTICEKHNQAIHSNALHRTAQGKKGPGIW